MSGKNVRILFEDVSLTHPFRHDIIRLQILAPALSCLNLIVCFWTEWAMNKWMNQEWMKSILFMPNDVTIHSSPADQVRGRRDSSSFLPKIPHLSPSGSRSQEVESWSDLVLSRSSTHRIMSRAQPPRDSRILLLSSHPENDYPDDDYHDHHRQQFDVLMIVILATWFANDLRANSQQSFLLVVTYGSVPNNVSIGPSYHSVSSILRARLCLSDSIKSSSLGSERNESSNKMSRSRNTKPFDVPQLGSLSRNPKTEILAASWVPLAIGSSIFIFLIWVHPLLVLLIDCNGSEVVSITYCRNNHLGKKPWKESQSVFSD